MFLVEGGARKGSLVFPRGLCEANSGRLERASGVALDASDTIGGLWVELSDPGVIGDVGDVGDVGDIGPSRGGLHDGGAALGLDVCDRVSLRSSSATGKASSGTDARQSKSPASSWREASLLGCCWFRNCCLKDSVTAIITSATRCIASVALRVSHTVVGVWMKYDDVGEIVIFVFVVHIHGEASRS